MTRSPSAIAALTLLLTLGCGGTSTAPSPTPSAAAVVNTCAAAHRSPHVAYLVVQHLSGQATERCAGFDGATIDGQTVMKATGIQYQAGAGTAMCQIDHEPAQTGDCSAEQAHWSLWLYAGGSWSAPTTDYRQLVLHDREALGWRYVPSSAPLPPIAPQPL